MNVDVGKSVADHIMEEAEIENTSLLPILKLQVCKEIKAQNI